MSRVEDLWERLVRAALRRERTGTDALGRPVGGIAGYVPSSLANNRDIDAILRAADEIQDEDPNVSRICTCIHFIAVHLHLICIIARVYVVLLCSVRVCYNTCLCGSVTSPMVEI